MPYSRRERLGMFLQRWGWTHRWLLEFDGYAPNDRLRYVNRLSGHLIVLPEV